MRRTTRTAAALAAGALTAAALAAPTTAGAAPVCNPDPRVCIDGGAGTITLGAGDGDLAIATGSGVVSIGDTVVGTYPGMRGWIVTAAEGYSGSVAWTGTRRSDDFDLTSAQPLTVAIAAGDGADNVTLSPAPLDGSTIDLGPNGKGPDLLRTEEGAGSLTIDLAAEILSVPRPQSLSTGPTSLRGVEYADVAAASVVAVGSARPDEFDVTACTADIRSGGGDDRVMVRADFDQRLADSTCVKTARVDLGPGNDWARTYNGNDVVLAGPGNDHVIGGDGDDLLRGGPGRDSLHGTKGDDTLVGGPGRDTGNGGPGTNRCSGVEKRKHCRLQS